MRPGRKWANWDSKLLARAAGIHWRMRNQRATAADHIFLTTVCRQSGWVVRELAQKAVQESWQIRERTACYKVESPIYWLLNVNLPCHHCSYIYVPQCRLSLTCQIKRGLEDCWPPAHLGTCWENFACAAECSVALRAPFNILNYLKFSHMILLLVWTGTWWQLVLETYQWSQNPQVPSLLIREDPLRSLRKMCIYVCMCVGTYV